MPRLMLALRYAEFRLLPLDALTSVGQFVQAGANGLGALNLEYRWHSILVP
jgi:hypothetical protein